MPSHARLIGRLVISQDILHIMGISEQQKCAAVKGVAMDLQNMLYIRFAFVHNIMFSFLCFGGLLSYIRIGMSKGDSKNIVYV